MIAFRQRELTQKQKDAILEFVQKKMLGDSLDRMSKEDREAELAYSNEKEEAMALLDTGWDVRVGHISFDIGEDIHQQLWRAICSADPENMRRIDTDLLY